MANRSKVNGQNKKMFNNFLDSLEIGNNITQINMRGGRGQKRNQQLLNSIKYESNELAKSNQLNPFKMMDEQKGRNLVNRSLCYESHNSSIQNNLNNSTIVPGGAFINQSFEYPSSITLSQQNAQNSFGYMTNQQLQQQQQQQHKSLDTKKLQQSQQFHQKQLLQQQSQLTQQLSQLGQLPHNQRNMVLNLSQIKNVNYQVQQKAAYAQSIVNANSQAHISKQTNKDVTKRSGTTGGTESSNIPTNVSMQSTNQQIKIQPPQQLLMNNYNTNQQVLTKNLIQSKSAQKKKGRQIVQQQNHSGISLRRIDKMRASSQLGNFAQNNITIDFDNLPSREGAQSTLAHIQHQKYTLQSIDNSDSVINSKNFPDSSFNATTNMMNTVEHAQSTSGNSSLQNISNQFNNSSLFMSAQKKGQPPKSQQQTQQQNQAQLQSQQLLYLQNICLDLETRMTQKEKDIEKSSATSTEKAQNKADVYLSMLDELSQKDKGFSQILTKIKNGLSGAVKDLKKDRDQQTKKTDEDKTELTTLKQKNEGYEKIMREMKKQIANYKNEIQGIKKMESYLNLENYQKLINEFNTLYDHYKGLKSINKKLKMELKQSNQRERTFLKLLKKTKEYGEQAAKLEQEYERLFKEDQRLGISVENLIIDSTEKRSPEIIEKGGIKIPKLDFTSIYIQREVVSSQNEGESNDEEGEDSQDESYYKEEQQSDQELDSNAKKEKFESQKAEFKKKMLAGKI